MKQIITLNEDQKAVVEREIKNAYSTLSILYDWVKNDSLSLEMKETLPKLVDGYMQTVKETIGFTGEESERDKELKKSIGEYYQKQINELQLALEQQGSIGSIAANVTLAFKKIDKWWDIEGFNYIREKSITSGGNVLLNLGFSLDSFTSNYSKTPVSDKEGLKTKVQYLIDKGFEFTPRKRGYSLDVIDNDNNRKLLIELVKQAFPTSLIYKFENHLRRTNDEKENYFVLRSVEVIIYDLNEIENLEVEEKHFSFNEDDERSS